MIPYGRQSISETDIEQVVRVLKSDFLTQGPVVPQFESAVATYCQAQYAVAANSATSALHVACLALGVGPGDIVWTSPTTFVASSNCALYCGARVDFVDIDPHTGNMSVDLLGKKLDQARAEDKLPKVVIPVHLCGQSCDMAAIGELASQYGFKIIEDASHGIGGRYRNEPVGNCRFSDIAVFSFHPVKIVTSGEGGMALTNDPQLARLMRQFRSHGITSDADEMEPRPANEIWNYQQKRLGFNYRLTDIQAVLGLSQVGRLDSFVSRRHEIAEKYDHAFKKMPISVLDQLPETYSSYHLYIIRIDETGDSATQRQVYNGLLEAGIGVNLHYIPVYRQPYYERMGFEAGYCPEAERYHREALSIPMFPTLSDDQQLYVIDTLQRLVKR